MLNDYYFYSKHFLKIKTKTEGITPFVLRGYQRRFIDFVQAIEGPKRVIVLKPRQAGFSTLIASIMFHRMATRFAHSGIAMADKAGRSLEIRKIYSTFLQELHPKITPLVLRNNTEEILFDDPNGKGLGLSSGVLFETAQDPLAGRSSARLWAHLSEAAFYEYYTDIDDGVQNSIPLSDQSLIVKESTANGRAGTGKPFYLLWQAAKRDETIYKPFFVAWYEIDDYKINMKTDLTEIEKDLLKRYKGMTIENLAWRRLKLSEYLNDEEQAYLSPEERFKQDFPSDDDEAFRSSGSPVYPVDIITKLVNKLNYVKPADLKDKLNLYTPILRQFWHNLRVYQPPRKDLQYFIGADCSEGLAIGDSSSLYVTDQNYNQVAVWHGKIDPDLYGHLLAALGEWYNNALLIVENNNMGHTTVTTLKNTCYSNIYKKVSEDKITKTFSTKYGWTTTGPSKQDMLNQSILVLREEKANILDVRLCEQMGNVVRGDNGNVDLNGKDRVVAFCLAMMGLKQYKPHYSLGNKKSRELYDLGVKHESDDLYS